MRDKDKKRVSQRLYRENHREHLNEQGKQLNQKRRLKAIEYLGGKCGKCDLNDVRVLEFHHKNGSRKGGPTMAQLSYSLSEAGKCELLCANCHRIESYYQAMDQSAVVA